MPYRVEVDPDVFSALTADSIPPEVKARLADALESFAQAPSTGYVDPVVGGPVHIVELRHNDFLWRFAFTLLVDEDANYIGITSVAINPVH
jgi:hypothetical protein